jgi:Domain of unknown function (DUF4194)
MHKAYSSTIVKLMQTYAIYDDDRQYWGMLQQHETPIREYFALIGLEIDLNRTDGYARLVQKEFGEDEVNPPIKLIRKIALTYEQSLLCVILRDILEENETRIQGGGGSKSYVTGEEIRNKIDLFFKDQNNKKALISKLDSLIEKMKDLGFLKTIREDKSTKGELKAVNNQYEIKMILRAKISNDELEEFKIKLQHYANSI